MRFKAMKFNFTIFKVCILNRKSFAWRKFESLTHENFTPFKFMNVSPRESSFT